MTPLNWPLLPHIMDQKWENSGIILHIKVGIRRAIAKQYPKFLMKYFLFRWKVFDIDWIGLSFVSFLKHFSRFHGKNPPKNIRNWMTSRHQFVCQESKFLYCLFIARRKMLGMKFHNKDCTIFNDLAHLFTRLNSFLST